MMASETFSGQMPDLDPIVLCEQTSTGWRGLTEHGEVLQVNGGSVLPDTDLIVMRGQSVIGRRSVRRDHNASIDDYLRHFNLGIEFHKINRFEQALREFDAALAKAPTMLAQYNKGLVLLGMGRWSEGFELYDLGLRTAKNICQNLPMPRWSGEDLAGKHLLLVHEAGYGDTIQQLRYVPLLRAMGARVSLMMPPQLWGLATQMADLSLDGKNADLYCPMLSLLHLLRQTAETIPTGPYLFAPPERVSHWRTKLGNSSRRRVGIAWRVGRLVDGDFPRSVPLPELVAVLPDAELISIQQQDQDQSEAEELGVRTFEFSDFSDCAALISIMDKVVTIDTAAAHVAGAIGHPDASVLLSNWASWRWVNNPFYPWFKLVRQDRPGDWASALRKLAHGP